MAKPLEKNQRELLADRAWELKAKGWTQEAIAKALAPEFGGVEVSQATVSRALKRTRVQVQNHLLDTAEQEALLQLAQLEHVLTESLAAWERSKGAAKTVTRRSGGRGTATEELVRIEGQAGDTTYLRAAMAAMEARRKILGIDAPSLTVDVSKMTDDELRRVAAGGRARR